MRQGNTGDKGPVITYHRGMGGGVGGFGAKHGETSPIPPLNLISPLVSPLITLDNFREPPPPHPLNVFAPIFTFRRLYLLSVKVHKMTYHLF